MARRKAIDPVSVSARKKTQPIITTSSVYTCGQIGHSNGPEENAETAEFGETSVCLRSVRSPRLNNTRSSTRKDPCHRPQMTKFQLAPCHRPQRKNTGTR